MSFISVNWELAVDKSLSPSWLSQVRVVPLRVSTHPPAVAGRIAGCLTCAAVRGACRRLDLAPLVCAAVSVHALSCLRVYIKLVFAVCVEASVEYSLSLIEPSQLRCVVAKTVLLASWTLFIHHRLVGGTSVFRDPAGQPAQQVRRLDVEGCGDFTDGRREGRQRGCVGEMYGRSGERARGGQIPAEGVC
jgi:hypothetical protein